MYIRSYSESEELAWQVRKGWQLGKIFYSVNLSLTKLLINALLFGKYFVDFNTKDYE